MCFRLRHIYDNMPLHTVSYAPKDNVSILKYSVTVRCTAGAAGMKRPNRASSQTTVLSKKVLGYCQNAASNSRTKHRLV
jgi:hypothetical protein